MSDEKFEPCTPPDSLFDTNAIAAAVKSETFWIGEVQVKYEVQAFAQLSPWDRIMLQDMADDFWAAARNMGWRNQRLNAGPWAISDMWRRR